jgi:hypothetical protein
MNNRESGLVGMFLILNSADHEHYRTGQITVAVGDCYLVQFDRMDETHPPLPLELYTVEEFSEKCENCGEKLANLFETREDMVRWIAWLSEPEKPGGQSGKVVHLKKPH